MHLHDHINEHITIKCQISRIMWQHQMISVENYPFYYYIDILGEPQSIAYSKTPIESQKQIEITGKVIKIEGSDIQRDPKRKETNDEFHILVDSWREIS